MLASSLNYTEDPQTMRLRPPFVMGYDVVGEIDQIGRDEWPGFQVFVRLPTESR